MKVNETIKVVGKFTYFHPHQTTIGEGRCWGQCVVPLSTTETFKNNNQAEPMFAFFRFEIS